MQNKNEKANYSSTPYDDVFRTMLVEGKNLIIPLINETFGESYTDDVRVINIGNIYMLLQQEAREQLLVLKEKLGITHIRVWNIFAENILDDEI